MVIREKMIGEVRPFVGKDVVKVITGIRRCGKSVLMSQIRDVIVSEIDVGAPVFYLDLDDEANAAYLKAGVLFKELTSVLEKNPGRKTYIFLDEAFRGTGDVPDRKVRRVFPDAVFVCGVPVGIACRELRRCIPALSGVWRHAFSVRDRIQGRAVDAISTRCLRGDSSEGCRQAQGHSRRGPSRKDRPFCHDRDGACFFRKEDCGFPQERAMRDGAFHRVELSQGVRGGLSGAESRARGLDRQARLERGREILCRRHGASQCECRCDAVAGR